MRINEDELVEDSTEFVAFSRKLLRSLQAVERAITSGNKEEALKLLDEMIEDTKSDIEG